MPTFFYLCDVNRNTRIFSSLAALFCVCLVASNIFETKIFNAGPLVLTGGFLVFPVSYIINDCITELYGLKNARFVIILGFAVNLIFVLVSQLVRILPPAEFWEGQTHLDYLFDANLRITAASMAAFLAGSLLNARVMAGMKKIQGKKGFGWRAILSTLVGEGVDSMVFFPIAFWGVGVRNLMIMMGTQVVLKTLFEIVLLPLTYTFVKHSRNLSEGADAK